MLSSKLKKEAPFQEELPKEESLPLLVLCKLEKSFSS
jgi:hypothetical protein